jgi:hypothetical protein
MALCIECSPSVRFPTKTETSLFLDALSRGCRWSWLYNSVFCVVVLPYLYIDSLSVGGGGAGQRQESREGKLPAGQ